MSWLDSLDRSIADALSRFPESVPVASFKVDTQTWLIGRQDLEIMAGMHLGHLPLSSIAVPYDCSDILTRPHEENVIRDVTRRLSDYFPNFFVAGIYELESLFKAQNIQAYMIGGLVRDMLLSTERRYDIEDVDIIIEGNALKAAQYVNERSNNFHLLQEFPPFGTAKLDYKGQIEIDFASTRQEIYPECGHLPEIVALGVPLEADIIRRDFTMNALALSISDSGRVIDCVGGLKDLGNKEIRLLKVPSFFEDPSRILRAFSFAIRLDFNWSEDTHLLLTQFLQYMPDVYKAGGERVRQELKQLLCLPESVVKVQWLTRFMDFGLHRLISTRLPAHIDLPLSLTQISHRLQWLQNYFEDWWTPELTWQVYISLLLLGLPETYADEICHRWLNRHEGEVVNKSRQLLNENRICPLNASHSPSVLYDAFHELPTAAAMVGLILSPQFEICSEAFCYYKQEVEPIRLEVTGDDILKLGVPQGKMVGQLLRELLQAKLQGQVVNRLDEITWLKTRMDVYREGNVL